MKRSMGIVNLPKLFHPTSMRKCPLFKGEFMGSDFIIKLTSFNRCQPWFSQVTGATSPNVTLVSPAWKEREREKKRVEKMSV
jgi:hypothetical protein